MHVPRMHEPRMQAPRAFHERLTAAVAMAKCTLPAPQEIREATSSIPGSIRTQRLSAGRQQQEITEATVRTSYGAKPCPETHSMQKYHRI